MNIEAEYNRRFDLDIEVTNDDDSPADLSGYEVKMQVKKHPSGAVFLDLSENIEVEDNNITIYLPSLDLTPSVYYYDLMIENEEGKQTILKGNFTVFNSISE